jgi:flagellar basal body L-ring protein FlgH
MLRKLNFIVLISFLMMIFACKTTPEKKEKKRRARRPYRHSREMTRLESDISYYRNRSPGAARHVGRSAIRRGLASDAVDGRMMRVRATQSDDYGSLWNSESRHNYLFIKKRNKNIGDIVYIKLKEDVRAMLKKGKKKRRYSRRMAGRRRRRSRGAKRAVKKAAAPAKPATPGGPKKKKKRSKKSLKKNVYIAARIIDKLPNNTFLLEGHKMIEVNKVIREILVSGYVKRRDINLKDEVDSRKMADLAIDYVVAKR